MNEATVLGIFVAGCIGFMVIAGVALYALNRQPTSGRKKTDDLEIIINKGLQDWDRDFLDAISNDTVASLTCLGFTHRHTLNTDHQTVIRFKQFGWVHGSDPSTRPGHE